MLKMDLLNGGKCYHTDVTGVRGGWMVGAKKKKGLYLSHYEWTEPH